jgi:hypothetical protein
MARLVRPSTQKKIEYCNPGHEISLFSLGHIVVTNFWRCSFMKPRIAAVLIVAVGLTGCSMRKFVAVRVANAVSATGPSPLERNQDVDLAVSWMKNMLKVESYLKSVPAAHGKTVLTSPTPDLQFFFRTHAWDEDAYVLERGNGHEDPKSFLTRIH